MDGVFVDVNSSMMHLIVVVTMALVLIKLGAGIIHKFLCNRRNTSSMASFVMSMTNYDEISLDADSHIFLTQRGGVNRRFWVMFVVIFRSTLEWKGS